MKNEIKNLGLSVPTKDVILKNTVMTIGCMTALTCFVAGIQGMIGMILTMAVR